MRRRAGARGRRALAAGAAALLGSLAMAAGPGLLGSAAAAADGNTPWSAAVPVPTVSTPPQVGSPYLPPGTTPAPGYTASEYFLSGTARAFTSDTALSSDGAWAVHPSGTTAPYAVRMVVLRPSNPAAFNGTVMVEWLNVSAGFENAVDASYARQELLRRGYAYIGVSAQWLGVESTAPPLVSGGLNGLKGIDPGRYGALHHPGDTFSYDIFSQAGRALTERNGVDPLGGLRPRQLLAAGESQAAFRMVTYINGVQPVSRVYDGFLVHSRAGDAADLSQSTLGLPGTPAATTPSIPAPVGVRIRTDLRQPVFQVETETDIVWLGNVIRPLGLGQEGYLPARQPDTRRIRTWELTGTSHVDAYFLGTTGDPRELTTSFCGEVAVPINAGPQVYAIHAAVRHLQTWVSSGTPPPGGPAIETADGAIARDPATGIARGGIRLPDVAVPTRTLTGERETTGNLLCALTGKTDPWDRDADAWDGTPPDPSPTPEPVLTQLYPSKEDFVSRFLQATADSVRAGYVLPDDADDLVRYAQSVNLG